MSSGFFELAQIRSPEDHQLKDLRKIDRLNIRRWLERVFLLSCFSAILVVAATDTWLAVVNEKILLEEKNPICEWLIQLAPESCGFFIAGKICGTFLVVATLCSLLRARYRYAHLVIAAVALFQVGLLAYLFLSDPNVDDWINFAALFDKDAPSIFQVAFTVAFE